jgi:hypothetical protein
MLGVSTVPALSLFERLANMTITDQEMKRFKLNFNPHDETIELVHMNCGEIVWSALIVDDFTIYYWNYKASTHTCSEVSGL